MTQPITRLKALHALCAAHSRRRMPHRQRCAVLDIAMDEARRAPERHYAAAMGLLARIAALVDA